jgi:hypothetical protein
VRPDELLDLLHETAASPIGAFFGMLQQMRTAVRAAVAAVPPQASACLASAAGAVESAINTMLANPPDEAAIATWKQAVDAFRDAEAALPGTGTDSSPKLAVSAAAARQALDDCQAALAKLKADQASLRAGVVAAVAAHQISLAVRKVAAAAVTAEQLAATETSRFEHWFNSAQDRAQQWFTMHARIWTVILAFIAAFGLQLDTVQIMRLLENSPDVRAKLVARADSLGHQSETVAAQAITPAMEQEVIGDLQRSYGPGADSTALDAVGPVVPGTDLKGAVDGVAAKLGSNPDKAKILTDYDSGLRRILIAHQTQQFSDLLADHSLGTLQLMPDPYPAVRRWSRPWPHLVGILLSVALLSLGGPFWFSLLSQLASLRTALADAVDKQPKQTSPPAKAGTS